MENTALKIGLVLGAGGARGYAHIGVLKVLTEVGLQFDYIAGTSMGGLIGAMFASGYDLHIIEGLCKHLKLKHIADLNLGRNGIVAGEKILEILHLLFNDKRIEDMPIPFATVATDIISGEQVIFREGSILEAIRATISIPGIFKPVIRNRQVLVDGAVLNRVPVDLVKDMGANFIIAVDVSDYQNRPIRYSNIFEILLRTMELMEKEVMSIKGLNADIIIYPKVGHINSTRFTRVEEAIREGENAAKQCLPEIMQKIEEFKYKEQIS